MQSPPHVRALGPHASHVSANLSAPQCTVVTDTGFGAGFGASAEKSACSLALFTSDAVASSPRNGRNQEARSKPAASNSTVSDP